MSSRNGVKKSCEHVPGVAVITRDESDARVVLFMRSETRARWRRSAASAREFRTQQYAPPQAGLPAGAVTIYTTGTADSRKPGNFFPPAGYGAAARGFKAARSISDVCAARANPPAAPRPLPALSPRAPTIRSS